MLLMIAAVASSVSTAAVPAKPTDFGVRTIPGASAAPASSIRTRPLRGPVSLEAAVAVGSRWGTVTSTRRSIARNRAVGGVRNSFHLSGRAIDIARRPGVSHAAIAAAYRNAGFTLIESLDEGDHSHFAFGSSGAPRPVQVEAAPASGPAPTQWRVVSAPSFAAR